MIARVVESASIAARNVLFDSVVDIEEGVAQIFGAGIAAVGAQSQCGLDPHGDVGVDIEQQVANIIDRHLLA